MDICVKLTNGKTKTYKRKAYFHQGENFVIYDPRTLNICCMFENKYVDSVSLHWHKENKKG
jgi:hypothetical protein